MITNFFSFINEEIEGVGFDMTFSSKRKLTPKEEIDPFGEEIWWDEPEPEVVGGREVVRPNGIAGAIGMDRNHRWRRIEEVPERPNRKVCVFQQNFPGLVGNYPNRCENVMLCDYYDDNIYTCPTCGKVSNQIMEHGDGWICGRCGLKTRIFGNSLRYWN